MATPQVTIIESMNAALAGDFDAVILIGDANAEIPEPFSGAIERAGQVDKRVGKQPLLLTTDVAGGRLIFAPTGPLLRDFDDVRSFTDAAHAAAAIARDAGAVKPVLIPFGIPDDVRYTQAASACFFGFCQALHEPLEGREAHGEELLEPIQEVGLVADDVSAKWLQATEAGRRVARDLAGTEPERMAPKKFAEYCKQVFANTNVKVTVIDDTQQLEHEYPLLYAVGRASVQVERHRPCVIRLEYYGDHAEQTLFMAGKGIVYDTGGADLKVGGHMAGMSRDKGGAAAVAGFVKSVAEMQPQHLNVVAELGAVRNSIGAEAFVADDIIVSHSGKRVRIGNTDAEGRLVLADLLSHLRTRQEQHDYPNPVFYSVATLTGHAALAKGPYSALVPNGPAKLTKVAERLFEVGEQFGDMSEISWSRREDYDIIRARTSADDVLSSNNGPSATTKRGHQFPMAFLTIAGGLQDHGSDSAKPLPYVHVDIAGSGVEGGDWQHGKPTAAPVLCFSATYLHK